MVIAVGVVAIGRIVVIIGVVSVTVTGAAKVCPKILESYDHFWLKVTHLDTLSMEYSLLDHL